MANTLGSLIIDLGANVARLQSDMGRATKTVEDSVGQMKRLAGLARDALGAIGVGLTAGAFLSFARSVVQAGDDLAAFSQKTNTAVEDLQRLQYAGAQANLSAEQVASGMRFLSKAIGEAQGGSKEMLSVFQALGIEVGRIKSTGEGVRLLAEQFERLEDGPVKAAAAMRLLGRSGADWIPLLNQGAEAIDALGVQLETFGGVISQKAAEDSDRFADALTQLKTSFTAIGQSVIVDAVGPLADLTESFVKTREEQARFNAEMEATFSSSSLVDWTEAAQRALAFLADTILSIVNALDTLRVGYRAAGGFIVTETEGLWNKLLGFFGNKEAEEKARESARRLVEIAERTQGEIASIWSRPTFTGGLENQLGLSPDDLSRAMEKSVSRGAASAQLTAAVGTGSAAADAAAKAYEAQGKKIAEVADQLQREIDALQQSSIETEKAAALHRAGTTEYTREGQAIAELVEIKAELVQQQEFANATDQLAADLARTRAADLEEGRRLTEKLLTPTEEYRKELERIHELAAAGAIDIETQARAQKAAADELDKARGSTKKATDAARELGLTFSSAFEDAIVGAKSFQEVLEGLLKDIARIITRKSITEPLGNALSSLFGGGLKGGIGSVFSAIFTGRTTVPQDFTFSEDLGFLPKFQHGGSFSVSGSGGPDSQIVAFRATPGERVTVTPPGGGGSAVNVNFHIQAVDARGIDELLRTRQPLFVGMIQSAFDKNGKRGMRR